MLKLSLIRKITNYQYSATTISSIFQGRYITNLLRALTSTNEGWPISISPGIYTIKEAYDVENTDIPYPGIIPEEVPPCLPGTRWDGVVVLCPEQGSPYIKPPTRVYHLWYQVLDFPLVILATF